MNVPDFDDPAWDARRKELQHELGLAAERLVDHMGAPHGCRGQFDVTTEDGRIISILLEAGERPKGN